MPMFSVNQRSLQPVEHINFEREKDLQEIVQDNLDTIFSCRFVASEFSTGAEHAGRIDTLAISEDNNPVIIEYKKVESANLINQSLYYLYWLNDHRGDFTVAAQDTLGSDVEIDWSAIRVLCIAPGFKKFDIHAVKVMGASIELWEYRYFDNGVLYFEEMFRRSAGLISHSKPELADKSRKTSLSKNTSNKRVQGNCSFDDHLAKANEFVKEIIYRLQENILSMDDSIEEAPKKQYIAYKVSRNFVCIEVRQEKVLLSLSLNPDEIDIPDNGRDVSKIGHHGTGDFELTIESIDQIETSMSFIKAAFQKVGG